VKYNVQLLRSVEQVGSVVVEAENAEEAREIALEVSQLAGVVVRVPDWSIARVRKGPVLVLSVEVAA
jgi:hypothetical protein